MNLRQKTQLFGLRVDETAALSENAENVGETRNVHINNEREPDMPLVKSKSPEAFRKNVKAEVAAGKPVAQSVAIAYAVKRAAAKTPAAKRPK